MNSKFVKTQMANKHMRTYPASRANKTIVFSYKLGKFLFVLNSNSMLAWAKWERLSYSAGENVNWYKHSGKSCDKMNKEALIQGFNF